MFQFEMFLHHFLNENSIHELLKENSVGKRREHESGRRRGENVYCMKNLFLSAINFEAKEKCDSDSVVYTFFFAALIER